MKKEFHYLVPNVFLRLDIPPLDILNAMFHQIQLSPLVLTGCMAALEVNKGDENEMKKEEKKLLKHQLNFN